jgi:septation ring formation regulator EzrA
MTPFIDVALLAKTANEEISKALDQFGWLYSEADRQHSETGHVIASEWRDNILARFAALQQRAEAAEAKVAQRDKSFTEWRAENRYELSTAQAEVARLREALEQAHHGWTISLNDLSSLRTDLAAAQAEVQRLRQKLMEIRDGKFDDLDPDDGLHRTSARAVARDALTLEGGC